MDGGDLTHPYPTGWLLFCWNIFEKQQLKLCGRNGSYTIFIFKWIGQNTEKGKCIKLEKCRSQNSRRPFPVAGYRNLILSREQVKSNRAIDEFLCKKMGKGITLGVDFAPISHLRTEFHDKKLTRHVQRNRTRLTEVTLAVGLCIRSNPFLLHIFLHNLSGFTSGSISERDAYQENKQEG